MQNQSLKPYIGWLVTAEDNGALRLVDIAILTSWRGRGIGRHLLEQVQANASAMSVSVVLHVISSNPARRLYERMGFVVVEQEPPYLAMRWQPVTLDT